MPRRSVPVLSALVAALALGTGLAACSSTSTLRLCNGRLEPIAQPGKPGLQTGPQTGQHR
jgi:hypothetical protein